MTKGGDGKPRGPAGTAEEGRGEKNFRGEPRKNTREYFDRKKRRPEGEKAEMKEKRKGTGDQLSKWENRMGPERGGEAGGRPNRDNEKAANDERWEREKGSDQKPGRGKNFFDLVR